MRNKLWHSPKGVFSAISPPLWLQEDLCTAEPRFPDVRALVFFADDLPLPAEAPQRRRYETHLIHRTFGQGRRALQLDTSQAHCLSPGLVSNGQGIQQQYITPPLPGCEEETIYKRATHALIQLEPRSALPAYSLLATTRLPAHLLGQMPTIIPQQFTLQHELEHLAQQQRIGSPITLRDTEKEADEAGFAYCATRNNQPLATFYKDWRALTGFMNPPDGGLHIYWNTLSQHGITAGPAHELASMLEVQMVSAAVPLPSGSADEASFVRRTLEPEESLPSVFATDRADRLRQLARHHHTTAYRYPHSYQLAEIVLQSARRLVPGVF